MDTKKTQNFIYFTNDFILKNTLSLKLHTFYKILKDKYKNVKMYK